MLGLLLGIFMFSFMGGDEWFLAGIAGALLIIGASMLWRPGESPVLLIIFLFQWVEVNLIIFHAAISGDSIGALGSYQAKPGDVGRAIALSNAALAFLALGFTLGMGKKNQTLVQSAQMQARDEPRRVWLKLYLLAFALAFLFSQVAGFSGPLFQVFQTATQIFRWSFFFMLTYVSFRCRPIWIYWWLLFFLEIFVSLGAFFSEFATVFFFALFGMIAAMGRPTIRSVRPLILVVVLMIVFSVIWTAVKSDYRAFVNQGSGQQVVLVHRSEQLKKLSELASSQGVVSFGALDRLARRVEYVTFFGIVLDVVPQFVPHSAGGIWADAMLRPFMPRLFFPGKTAINDSDRTNTYTLRNVATAEQGTSISLGYVAESYIDFGVPWMFLPIFIFATGLGYFFRWLQRAPGRFGVWRMGLATVAVFPFFDFGTSITKSVGALVISGIICAALVGFGLKAMILWAGKRKW
jgi:hypothetical protein